MTQSSLGGILGKAFLPGPKIYVTVYTVGGCDDEGNDVYEPIVFDGYYKDAIEFFNNEENLLSIDSIVRGMPDGYIIVEVGNYATEVYDVYEIMETIENYIQR